MAIYLRNGVYWVDLVRNGKRIRRSAKTTDAKKAQELHDKLASDLWQEKHLDQSLKVTLAEVMISWLAATEDHDSRETEIIRMNWLRENFGDSTPLEDITPDDVIEKKSKELWRGNPVKKSTINRHLSALSALYTHALEKKMLKSKPHFSWFSEKGNRRTRKLDRLHMVRLLAELPWHLATIFCFGIMTGLRENNIIELRWSQVDLENQVIRYEDTDMKGDALHIVPFTDDVAALLKLVEKDDEEFVFVYQKGGKVKPVTRASNHGWYSALKRAGLTGMTFHEATRHTWASWHAMSGTPPQVLKELGAWKDMRMVERYTHLAPEHLKKYAGNLKIR